MSKTLIVTEKYSVVGDFLKALEDFGKFDMSTRRDRYYENDKYVIAWLQGHFLSTIQPKEYPDYEEKGGWSLKALPYQTKDGYHCDFKINPKVSKEFQQIKKVMLRKDIDLIINACDAEREGELIFWEMYDYLKLKNPVKRFWESSVMTKKNILDILNGKLKDESFYKPIRDAAYARQFADWMLGMNFTTGFTIKSGIRGRALHMGRVKTPTIAILVNRELEIQNFKAQHYYEIDADFGKYKGKWFSGNIGNTKIEKQEEALAIVEKVKDKIGIVTSKEVTEDKEFPKSLYDLPGLQYDAGKKLGLSAKQVLEVAQSLYDKHKVLSYPRTESTVLGEEHVAEIPKKLESVSYDDFIPFVSEIKSNGIPTNKRFINNEELTDHHAIVPTEVKPNLSAMNDTEKAVYEMVVRRFLSVFYPPALYEKTNIVTTVEGETFKTNGKILIDAGWKVVYGGEADEDEEETEDKDKKNKGKGKKEKEQKLPPIDKDESNTVVEVKEEAKETKPPKRFTEPELVKIMKQPSSLLDDKELKQVMKGAGLGTGATRDSILEEIVRQEYVEKKGKAQVMIPTELAMKSIGISPEELKSPQITAEWEMKLKEVSQGKYPVTEFLNGITEYVTKNLEELKNTTFEVSFQSVNDAQNGTPIGANCPDCGKEVLEKKNVYSCQSHTKDSSCFVVFKTVGKKKISASQVKQIASKGVSNLIKGFTSQKGTKFDAKLKWNKETKKVEYEFEKKEPPKQTNLTCPFCGKGEIKESPKAFGCSNWQGGCKFTVWKVTSGKKMTLDIVKKLVEEKQTDKMSGFKSANGKEYSARLVLNIEKKKIDFSFE